MSAKQVRAKYPKAYSIQTDYHGKVWCIKTGMDKPGEKHIWFPAGGVPTGWTTGEGATIKLAWANALENIKKE